MLITAQSCARGGAHHAVRRTGIKTFFIERRLQLTQLVSVQRVDIAGPRCGKGWAAVDLACQKAYAQCVVDRVVVAQDGGRLTVDIEVKTDDKGVETSEVMLDIQPLPKKERSAKSEPAEPEEATAD